MADATRRVSVRLSLDDAARVKAGLREVGETGQRSLDQIKGGAERASRSLELLDVATRGIQIAGVAVAARALVQAGDALTQSLSRLPNATGSVERASAVYEALYRNALSTGVAVSESVDAFQRFAIAAREIGATSDQVVRLVGGLQRVAIVSGASTQEISSANPALAAGAPRGALAIQTQGWWPNGVAVGAGDLIGLAGRLHIATETVTASGAGTATIPIAPPLREALLINQPLVLTKPTVAMRLMSDGEATNPTRPGRFTAITIRREEAL